MLPALLKSLRPLAPKAIFSTLSLNDDAQGRAREDWGWALLHPLLPWDKRGLGFL